MTDLLTGNLLVASSLVTDPIYSGGVCLVVHQDETNVIGVMLNRPMKPSPETLQAMFGEKSDQNPRNRLTSGEVDTGESEAKEPKAGEPERSLDGSPWRMLHFGGPLSGPVVAVHQISQYAEAETGSGVYVAAQKHHLEDLIRQQVGPYRLIVGHLGWETEQLIAEIESGRWHLVPATVDSVFSAANQMWPALIRRATSNSLARWIGVDDVIGACELN